jgi:apolipoprotein N-acyltransferase
MLISAALALLSGLLYVFSFAPWDLGWLQWVAFLPLLIGVQRIQDQTSDTESTSTWKKYALLGFLMNLVICIGGFYWIVYSVQQYGGLPFGAALIVFAFFCIIGQLQIPLYLLLREWARKSKRIDQSFWAWPLLAGAFYAGIESLYPKLFSDTAGNAFYKNPWIRQAVDLGGPFVLTSISISVNEWLARAWLFKELRSLLSAVIMIVLVSTYGAYRVHEWTQIEATNSTQPKLSAALLQANIGDFLKLDAERGASSALEQVLQAYLQLGTQALSNENKPDLIVWPETAYPLLFEKPHNEAERNFERLAKEFARRSGVVFGFGGYDQDLTRQEFNSFFFYDPQNDSHQVYHKHHLLMFGETLPFADIFPSMRGWFPTMGFFGRGEGAISVTVKNATGNEFRLAPSIC